MPRLLRILGALVASFWTLIYAVTFGVVLLLFATPFISGFLLPLFAGTLLLIFLSYLFSALATLTGASPPSNFTLVLAGFYILTCTVVLVIAVGRCVIFLFSYPQFVIVGVLAMFLFLLPHALQVLAGYVLAATFAPAAPFNPAAGTGGVDSPAECLFRGTLIGMNTAMNAVFGVLLYGLLFSPFAITVGPKLGIAPALFAPWLNVALVTILILATFGTTLSSATVPPPMLLGTFVEAFIKALAGWLSWLMPMSWVYCAYGSAAFYGSWIGHFLRMLAPGSFPGSYTIVALRLDGGTGVMTLDGGVASTASNTAYNTGCFSFVSSNRFGVLATRQHEAGHHLHLAAFGSFFHWIDGVNENGLGPIAPQGAVAYGERVAESNVVPPRSIPRPEVPVWR